MQRIDFEGGAVATLRRRVAEVEGLNEDLVAFARGHAGAVSTIHDAVLAMLPADTPDALALVLAHEWPLILRVDEVAFAWGNAVAAYRGDRDGVRPVEPRLIARMAEGLPPVSIRQVSRGHALFAATCDSMRSEAIVRLDGMGGNGIIVLGQREEAAVDGRHGARLLRFLGSTVSHMLDRWPPPL